MSKFTRIPQNTFSELQMDAGILLRQFDPTGATPVADADIITATTGGINIVCEPEYSDLGEDVDNCPNNMKELKHLDSWNCTMGFTCLGASPEVIKLALGAADINGTTKIVPRRDLEQTDFADIWWVGDRADGGMVAVRLINALSTGGLNLQTTKNGKGQTEVELTGHVSINAQNTMPMEFYSASANASVYPEVNLSDHTIDLAVNGTHTLTADVIPNTATVAYSSANTSVATVDASTGVVTGVAAGDTIVTATITVDSVEYTDTCTVIVKASS